MQPSGLETESESVSESVSVCVKVNKPLGRRLYCNLLKFKEKVERSADVLDNRRNVSQNFLLFICLFKCSSPLYIFYVFS